MMTGVDRDAHQTRRRALRSILSRSDPIKRSTRSTRLCLSRCVRRLRNDHHEESVCESPGGGQWSTPAEPGSVMTVVTTP